MASSECELKIHVATTSLASGLCLPSKGAQWISRVHLDTDVGTEPEVIHAQDLGRRWTPVDNLGHQGTEELISPSV